MYIFRLSFKVTGTIHNNMFSQGSLRERLAGESDHILSSTRGESRWGSDDKTS